jgi:hypothetical protein
MHDYAIIFTYDTGLACCLMGYKSAPSLKLLVIAEEKLRADYRNYKRISIIRSTPLDIDERALLSRLEEMAA